MQLTRLSFDGGGSLKAASCTFLSMGRPGHDVVLADLTSFGTRRIT
jgi:hypothetical protein